MRFSHFFLSLLFILCVNIIYFYESINNYIEQKYHIDIIANLPLEFLQKEEEKEILITQIQEHLPKYSMQYPYIKKQKIFLKPQSTFLLVGDSMMQGIGMHLVPALKKLDMQAINEAKQSTGLTYTKFFDWPKELEKILQEQKIDVIVIMLGANDPWNIRKKIHFGTQEWDDIYNERIQKILQLAHYYQSLIIWYEVPLVKNKKLSLRIPHLNNLYQQATQSSGNLFIKTNFIFAPDDKYTPFMQDKNGKSISLRANDGIHFTHSASKILTNLLIQKLEIISNESQGELE